MDFILLISNIHLCYHHSSNILILIRLLSSSSHHQIRNHIRILYSLAYISPPFKCLSILHVSNHMSCYIRYYNSCYLHNRKVVRIGLWTIIVHYYYNNNFPSLYLLTKLWFVFKFFRMVYIIQIRKKGYKIKKFFKTTIQKL